MIATLLTLFAIGLVTLIVAGIVLSILGTVFFPRLGPRHLPPPESGSAHLPGMGRAEAGGQDEREEPPNLRRGPALVGRYLTEVRAECGSSRTGRSHAWIGWLSARGESPPRGLLIWKDPLSS